MSGRRLAVGAILALGLASDVRGQTPPAVADRRAGAAELFLLGLEARHAEEPEAAARSFEAAVGLDPEAVLPRLEWAAALMVLGRSEAVEAALKPLAGRIDSLADSEPSLGARYYRLRAAAASRAGHTDRSLSLYETAARYAPLDLGLRAQLIGIYRARDAPERAIVHMQAAAELMPGNADLRVELGRALLDLTRWAEAEEVFRSALAIRLGHEGAWDGLGLALAHQRRFASAEEAFRAGLRVAPASARLYEHLGDALLNDSRPEAALAAYRRAAALSPTDPAGLTAKIERARAALPQ